MTTVDDIAAYIAASAGAALLAVAAKESFKRRMWVDPKKRRRESEEPLLRELKLSDTTIFQYKMDLRMPDELCKELLSLVEASITKQDTSMRKAITAQERYAITLQYLSSGLSYRHLEYRTGISGSAMCNFIPEACNSIFDRIKNEYMVFPKSPEEWKVISDKFASKWNFPNCIGVICGWHSQIRTVRIDMERKKRGNGADTLDLIALVDPDYKIMLIELFRYRADRGDDIKNCEIFKFLSEARSLFPQASMTEQGKILPYVAVAKNPFTPQDFLLTPYTNEFLSPQEEEFNSRIEYAARVGDIVLSTLIERFKILQTSLCLNISTIEATLKACAVLHNFLITKSKKYAQDVKNMSKVPTPIASACSPMTPNSQYPEMIRNNFAEVIGNCYINDGVIYSYIQV